MFAKKGKSKQYKELGISEAFNEIKDGVKASVVDDVAKGLITDAWKQFLQGTEAPKSHSPSHGEMKQGEEIDLLNKKEATHKADIEPGIDYHREIKQSDKRALEAENYKLQTTVEEIKIELKQLVSRSKEVQNQLKDVAAITVEQRVVKAGKYHESFFSWILVEIRKARAKIEDSAAWLSAVHSKGQKRDYWSMFEQHGTSFGMSNERNVATQTG